MLHRSAVRLRKEPRLARKAQPVCPHCFRRFLPHEYYCPRCGEAVGQLTGYIPFVSIRFYTNFYGKMWRKVWYDENIRMLTRAICLVLIIIRVPVMVLGLPVVLRDIIRDGRRRREDAAGQREAKSAGSQEEDS